MKKGLRILFFLLRKGYTDEILMTEDVQINEEKNCWKIKLT